MGEKWVWKNKDELAQQYAIIYEIKDIELIDDTEEEILELAEMKWIIK